MVTSTARSERRAGRKYLIYNCHCGNQVAFRSDYVPVPNSSCGCSRYDWLKQRRALRVTHGQRHTKLYNVWVNMKTRCDNPNALGYENYGGRGISYEPNWKLFEGFAADMGGTYKPGLFLERVDNEKGYNKENCKWATRFENNNNKRSVIRITHGGATHTMSQWARIKGIRYTTLYMRIKTYRWSINKSLNTPV